MPTRYSLRQMRKEIPADEALMPKTRKILTQAEIQRRIKRKQAQPREQLS